MHPPSPPLEPVTTERFRRVRGVSVQLCAPLAPEDHVIQAEPDASPAKWHLAHTTWFFETFVLERHVPGWRSVEPLYRELFNSYYVGVGARFPRPARGHLSRPTVAEVHAYREQVDTAMARLLDAGPAPGCLHLVELGLHHEQQHQELLCTDLVANLSVNPLRPRWRPEALPSGAPAGPASRVASAGGLVEIGHAGERFHFDNEGPRHRVWLPPYALASRPVTNREWLSFVEDGGYATPSLWLSEGWDQVEAGVRAPRYWRRTDAGWLQFTAHGEVPLDLEAPVAHVSGFEAAAFAEWAGARLPSEAEWEAAFSDLPVGDDANLLERGAIAPRSSPGPGVRQVFGDVWEWTRSAYGPYPGYRPAEGAVGEYNGKFMSGQWVLRGGSCATPLGHVRATYRNFFQPDKRWQFSGVRLAWDA